MLTDAQEMELARLRLLAKDGRVRYNPVGDLGSIMVSYMIGNRLRRKIIFTDGGTHPAENEPRNG